MDWLIPIILVLDQISKKMAQEYLAGKNINIIGDFISLSYVTNTGIAFGMLQGYSFFHGILATVVVTIIYIFRKNYLKNNNSILFDISTIFIIGGALGNIYDRIRLNYVVDMFSVKYFSVFNVADSFVTVGGILLAIYYWRRSKDPWKKTF
ncbi:signal peptidase II [Marinitoga hydrogenitolerans DSM 16785]|uniref:Lipoprotein signal peptidase n=1 Tax=Marinitoga hydrogenitolerans (strain DSM 16785 / JCM 12826 / AT1271) TaxID=1122195 RepID=A0A1M4WYZ6_MARH1|nr:signal peptidase II [Marinitoga hydrogenitolerans]SHE86491.1 signal peptidase II [Marinitoga hydrogenitolerans DSM 16785]